MRRLITKRAVVCRQDVRAWALTYTGPKFHALLADPPYHLLASTRNGSQRQPGTGPYGRHKLGTKGFMGKEWDGGDVAHDPDTWQALAEHLHPGGFGVVFASSRGWHRLACAIEDAGLTVHPTIFGWVYGSGFPKATRIDTQVDKEAGAEREVVETVLSRMPSAQANGWGNNGTDTFRDARRGTVAMDVTAPATDLAKTWQHHRYGLQALKPALEPIIVFQRPL